MGRSCVHPKQIEIINDVFSTSPQELAEAANILDALDKGKGVATDSQGRMIDEASARLARRIIERNSI
ncbi:MAG: HpcH/HpaI aldolase/citrate lyase family protein [Actinomycetes bacterium]